MPIIHSEKLIFIHIPRTGGTSINQYFLENKYFKEHTLNVKEPNFHIMYGLYKSPCQTYELDHLDYYDLKKFTPEPVFKDYNKFAIIRDPVDRLYSDFGRIKLRNDKRLFNTENMNFDEFVEEIAKIFENGLNKLGHFKRSHLIPQINYVPDNDDVEILKFENLSSDWDKFCKGHKLNNLKLPHKNKSNKSKPVISAHTKSIIEEIYRDDYNLLFNKG